MSDVHNPDEITAAVFSKRNSSSSLTGLVMAELQDTEFYKISGRATVPDENFKLMITNNVLNCQALKLYDVGAKSIDDFIAVGDNTYTYNDVAFNSHKILQESIQDGIMNYCKYNIPYLGDNSFIIKATWPST